jgi:hypothetical protein
MLLTTLCFCQPPVWPGCVLLAAASLVGSGLLWWLMVPFAVAANEDRWHAGGYVPSAFCLLWHILIFAMFREVGNATPRAVVSFGFDLFFLTAAVIVCGFNAAQAIVALAEPMREDHRREIRQAIKAFQQFRRRLWGVDLYNYVAMVSARPLLYFLIALVAVGLLIADTVYILYRMDMKPRLWVFLVRNAFALVLVIWQAFWYQAAFQRIQRKVYAR